MGITIIHRYQCDECGSSSDLIYNWQEGLDIPKVDKRPGGHVYIFDWEILSFKGPVLCLNCLQKLE